MAPHASPGVNKHAPYGVLVEQRLIVNVSQCFGFKFDSKHLTKFSDSSDI